MNNLPDIPLEPNGIAFCEFTSPDPVPMAKQLLALGFVAAARREEATLFRQGNAAFVINSKEGGHAAEYRRLHGASVSATALRVASATQASRDLLARGARVADADALYPNATAFEGLGGTLLYLVEGDPFSRWEEFDGWREALSRRGCGLDDVDHLYYPLRAEDQSIWTGLFTHRFGLKSRDSSVRYEGIEQIVLRTRSIDMTAERLRANGVGTLCNRNETSADCDSGRVTGNVGGRRNGQIATERLFGSISFGIVEHIRGTGATAFELPDDELIIA